MQTIPETKFQLTYCDNIESIEGNIINVNADFMSILKSDQEISIEGNSEDQLIFNVGDKNFKLRGIFLPTTMLIVPALTSKSLSDNSNSNPPNSSVAKIYLETFNYLKIQNHEMNFQHIYSEISTIALTKEIISKKLTLEQLLQSEGITISELKSKFQITPTQIEKLARAAPFTFFPIVETQDTLVIELSQNLMASMLRQLIQVLMSKGQVGEWFTYNQVKQQVPLIHEKFLEVITRHFSLQSQPPLPPPTIHQQQAFEDRKYKITLDTILQFIIVQQLSVKNQYIGQQMEGLIKGMLQSHLPAGNEQFSEQKAKQRMPYSIGKYFISLVKANQNLRIYYNPLLMDFNVKARIQQISDFKKKFSRAEINGIFSFWYSQQQIEDILLKNFRKMGKEYEIKLIIPK